MVFRAADIGNVAEFLAYFEKTKQMFLKDNMNISVKLNLTIHFLASIGAAKSVEPIH